MLFCFDMKITARRVAGNRIWVADSECSEERATQISSPVIPRVIAIRKSRISSSLQLLMASRKNLTKNWRIMRETRKKFATVHHRLARARACKKKRRRARQRRRRGKRKRRFAKDGEERWGIRRVSVKERNRALSSFLSSLRCSRTESRRTDGRRNGDGEQVRSANLRWQTRSLSRMEMRMKKQYKSLEL